MAIGSVTTGVGAPLMLLQGGSEAAVQPGADGKIQVAPAGSKFCVWDTREQALAPLDLI